MTPRTAVKRRPFQTNWLARVGWLVVLIYAAYAISALDISWTRFVEGLGNGAKFIGELFPPNFERWKLLVGNLIETIEIAVIASAFGILFSLPIGLLAARNLMPPWATWPARTVICVCRSFHPVIFAILFVKAVGFGPMAGILTLIFASIGFIGKLFAEAIEEISLKPVEACRAAGAPFMSVLIYAVMPQVLNRFIGFATYQFDANMRNSTMVGIVGAGGIGGTLFAAFQRYDYDFLCAILLSIIGLIMISEFLAVRIKAVFND
ncbi:Phosphonate ABC transporter, inner membrane subunit [Pseudodesulfovibrio profundus]|uniref:Phosphonate ABC transporter, inner membrane subunit n=1 Tax=Pseudodesulfovibrio profundus TaxID=57320 RepID=A0A2C8FD59_9BACT|nr:phosphonate ABC transporter, permease protein PhnE [Pseudodesulfovibrio profundus]MBC16969.1 phosphonate ABC transporter, permease protein PhnE [Desulfovibrio sp.]SOB60427.1 Phosphonate ABC transporter, inner membrane subunit [Pseudodesulfovibrio profundus]|tara:strand:+ start:954 stop:1745 length:792 start_codon:yes stop_codon:yes gene_type:complete